MRGTYRWMAPELLSIGDTEEFGSYPSFSSDVYALAIVIWQVRVDLLPSKLAH